LCNINILRPSDAAVDLPTTAFVVTDIRVVFSDINLNILKPAPELNYSGT